MKKRAFINYELKTLPWISAYFMLFFSFLLYNMYTNVRQEYMRFLQPEKNYTRYGNPIFRMFEYDGQAVLLIGIAIGVALLIYTQFRDIKNIEIGRFLKALPFSSREVYKIKLGMGILSFTIPYGIFSLLVFKMRNDYLYWMKDFASVSIDGDLIFQSNGIGTFASFLCIWYLIFLMMYTFGMMMQYIIANSIFSIILSAISFFVPIYVFSALDVLYGFDGIGLLNTQYSSRGIYNEFVAIMYKYLFPLVYGSWGTHRVYPYSNTQSLILHNVGLKVFILVVISLLSIVAGYFLVKRSKIEDAEVLISFDWARKGFVMGTSVCFFLLTGLILGGLSNGDIFETPIGIIFLHAIMALVAAIVAVVSKKIAYLGQVKK